MKATRKPGERASSSLKRQKTARREGIAVLQVVERSRKTATD